MTTAAATRPSREELRNLDVDADEWVSEEQRKKAIETDSLWHLQVYPHTPVGFYRLFAADLEALLDELERRAGMGPK